MEITVKNLKVAEFASEETLCYEATVYVDGMRAFTARNDGHGGPDYFHPIGIQGPALLKRAEEWASAQPAITYEMAGHAHSYIPDLEHFVGEAVTKARIAKDLKRDCSSKLVGLLDGKIYTWKISPAHPKGRDAVREKNPGVKFLNDMPLAEAIEAYKLAG